MLDIDKGMPFQEIKGVMVVVLAELEFSLEEEQFPTTDEITHF